MAGPISDSDRFQNYYGRAAVCPNVMRGKERGVGLVGIDRYPSADIYISGGAQPYRIDQQQEDMYNDNQVVVLRRKSLYKDNLLLFCCPPVVDLSSSLTSG